LILWFHSDQPYWGGRVKRLKVGTARGFSSLTRESLAADLRTILAPQYASRAREIATRMTKPAASVAKAADLMENLARIRRIG
jgi:UDP:flavonoid glycosyltransferase YjiC (YdhE family)